MLRSLGSARSRIHKETSFHYSANIVFLAILIFLFTAALVLASFISYDTTAYPPFGQQELIAQVEVSEEAIPDTNQLLTYENDTYGIRIKYPADWTYFGSVKTGGVTDIVLFQAPLEGRTDPSSAQFDVFTDTLPSDANMSLEEYTDTIINNNKLSDPTYNVIESSADGGITLLGRPAYNITDTYVLENTTYVRMEIGTFVDGKVYATAYDADEAEFYKSLPIAQEMINSFELLAYSGNPTIEGSGAPGTNLLNLTSEGNFTLDSSNTTSTTISAVNQTAIPSTLSNYENATYGVKLQYPSEWEVQQDPNNLAFRSSLESAEDPFREGVSILVENIQFNNGTVMSLDDYVNSVINSFQQSGVNINISDWVPTSLTSNGAPAIKLLYTWNNGEMTMKTLDIYTIDGNNAYTISYGAPVASFDSYMPTVQRMIDAFEILPSPSGQNETALPAPIQQLPIPPTPPPTPQSQQPPASIPEVGEGVNFLTYENTTYGVRMQHPLDWGKSFQRDPMYSAGEYIVGFRSPDASASLDIEMEESDQTLQEYATGYSDPKYATVLESEPTILAGYPAHKLVYDSNTQDSRIMHLFAKVDSRIYILTYGSESGRYSDNLPTVQEIINSFQTVFPAISSSSSPTEAPAQLQSQ